MLKSKLLLFKFSSSVPSFYNLLDTVEDLALVAGLEPLQSLGFEFKLFDLEHVVSLEPIFEVFGLLALLFDFGLDLRGFDRDFHLFQSFVTM